MSAADKGDDAEEVRRKLSQLQQYIPLMKSLINNAEKTTAPSPSVKQKMRHLLDVLQSTDKLPKLNLLLKCEVLLAGLKTSNLVKRTGKGKEKLRSKQKPSGSKHSSSAQQEPADSDERSGKTSSGNKSNDNKERKDDSKNKKSDKTESSSRGSGKSSQSSRHNRRSPSSDSDSDHKRRSSSKRRHKSHRHSRRERSTSSDSSHSVGKESRHHRKSGEKRRNSPKTIDLTTAPESPEGAKSPDIIFELEKASDRGRSQQKGGLQMGHPKSPSPPASPVPEERSDPKLIPLEPQMSILDLPMPPPGDDDCELEVIGATPKDPRPIKNSILLKSRANLRVFTQKLMNHQMSGSSDATSTSSTAADRSGIIAPSNSGISTTSVSSLSSNMAGSNSNTSGASMGCNSTPVNVSDASNYPGSTKTIEYGHSQSRPTSATTSTSSFDENPYSPINVDVQLDPHIDDDIDEEMDQDEAGPTSQQLPPPNLPPPSFDLPNRPTSDILSMDDIASLTAGITSLPSLSKSAVSPKSKTHDGRSVAKINDFIPARGVIGRVPSHLMASKGATPKTTPKVPTPNTFSKPASFTNDPRNSEPRMSTDPRAQFDTRMSTDPRAQCDTRTSTDLRGQPDPRTSTDLRGQPDPRTSTDPRGQPDPRTSTDPRGQPDPRTSTDPRGQPDPRTSTDPRGYPIPRKEGDPRMQQAGKMPSPNVSHIPGNRPIPEPPIISSNKPVWGVSNFLPSNPMPPSPRPLISPTPPFSATSPSIGLPPIVTPAGIPINKGAPIPVIGGPYSRYNAPHMGPRPAHFMGHYVGGPRMGGPHHNYQQNYMNPHTPRTYAEHRAARQRAEEDEKRRKAEEDRRAKEAEKRALAAKNLTNRPSIASTSGPSNRAPPFRPPIKKPLTKLIDAQPLVPPVKPNATKGKGKADEKLKTDDKAKLDAKKTEDKSKPKMIKPQERRVSSERKEEKSQERRLSSDKKEERRTSTEEKHVDKSLEKMSPLDSLYGEMPGPKVGHGYGFQKFRIPRKPKTKEPTPPPKDSEAMEEDEYEDFGDVGMPSSDLDDEVSQDSVTSGSISEPTKTETKQLEDTESGRSTRSKTKTSISETEVSTSPTKSIEGDKTASTLKSSPQVMATVSTATVEPQMQPVAPLTVDSALVEEFTRQQIETVVNKLFASEDAEKILNAKLLDVFKKLKPDNYEKIKKLLDEDDHSESEEEVEVKKKSPRSKKKMQTKPSPKKSPPKPKSKKKIETPAESESENTSDNEPLARKIVKVSKLDSESEESEKTPEKQPNEAAKKSYEVEGKDVIKEVKSKRVTRNSQKSETESLPEEIEEQVEKPEELEKHVEKPEKNKKQEELAEDSHKPDEKTEEIVEDEKKSESTVEEKSTTETKEKVEEREEEEEPVKEETPKLKATAKKKFKKLNELDRLHEDIRDMFICEGVLKASGPRNVRLVNYAISPETSALKASRKAKKDSLEQLKSVTPSDTNIDEEIKEMQPSTSKADLPTAYVRLEKKDLSPFISRPSGTDDEISMDGSVTLSSGRSSHASTRNVARRGRKVTNQGSRSVPTSPPDNLEGENQEDDTASTEMDAASEAGTETSENPPSITCKPTRGRGRGRGRKTKWQLGKPPKYNKKQIPVKKLTVYQPRSKEDLCNSRYYFDKNSSNPVIRCLICVYEGKKIVDHYLDHHPDVEVLFSRLAPEEITHALKQPENFPPPAEVMSCRFCSKEFLNIDELYDHTTEHTGEYRYKCPVCPNYIKSQSKTAIYHIKNCHEELSSYQPLVLKEGPNCEDTNLPGYVCGYCRFVQFDKETVEKHIEKRHRNEKGATITPNLEEINVINMAKWCQERGQEYADSPLRGRAIPKTEVDNDSRVPHEPAELPTLNFSTTTEDQEEVGVKLESTTPEKEKPNNVTPEENTESDREEEETEEPEEDLSSLDLQLTLSTLRGLLTEATNNPKSLLETIRSQRYESMEGDDDDDDTQPATAPATENKEPEAKASETKSKLPTPLTSTLEDPTEDSTSSSEDEVELNKSESSKPSINLLRPGLLDKLKSSIQSSSTKLPTDNNDTTSLLNDEDSNTSLQGPSTTESEPTTRKRKLTDQVSCYACDFKTDTISDLKNHIEGHTFEISGTCPMCDFPIGNTKKALTHLEHDHAEKRASLAPETSSEEQNQASSRPLIRIKPLNQLLASDGPTPPADNSGVPPQQNMVQPVPQIEPPNLMPQMPQLSMTSDKPNTFATLPAGSRVTIGPRKQAASPATLPPPQTRTPPPPTQPPICRSPAPKHAPSPIYVKSVKSASVYAKMMIPTNLRNSYKCMDSTCSFSTDREKKFIKHLEGHETIVKDNPLRFADQSGKKRNGWRQCAYCSTDVSSTEFVPAEKLIQHFKQCHKNCVFQCAYCFYRSASKSNVLLHETQSHGPFRPQIYMCSVSEPSIEETLPDQTKLLGNLVMPYRCKQATCTRQFYNQAKFIQHMNIEHKASKTFKCHVCETSYISPNVLLDHYKVHAYAEFQCMICRHGTDAQDDMHRHLCIEHPNYTACLLVRSMLGSKSQRNVLQGALRRLEMSNITADNIAPVEDESEEEEEENDDFPPTLHIPSPEPSECNDDSQITISSSVSRSVAPSVSDSATYDEDMEYDEELGERTHKQSSTNRENQDQDQEDLDGHDLYICSNTGCLSSFEISEDLVEHLMVCDMTRTSSTISCYHCQRTFRHISGLIEHLKNIHGPKRFTCGLCNEVEFRTSSLPFMYRHFRQKHKTVSTLLKPIDPLKNNQDTDKFIVVQKPSSPTKSVNNKKSKLNVYSPSEIEQLPKQPIFQTPVQCSECNFTDRVRTNMIRHLKSHVEDGKEITKAIPINPMPCLESKERFFDKMTNWAGSSHRNPDGTLKPARRQSTFELSDSEKEKLPVFVPTSRRYVCGAQNCSYLTTDIDMLRLHVTNLHFSETTFNCPHCPTQDWLVTADAGPFLEKALSHIKMHGEKLYRCPYCSYFHSQIKYIERHMTDKHKDIKEVKEIMIIREPDLPEQEPPKNNTLTPTVNQWLCSECGHQSMIYDDMKIHCKNEHGIKSQYRCSICTTRASSITTMDLHFVSKHPLETVLMYASFYRTDFTDGKVITGVPTVESREPIKAVPTPAFVPMLETVRTIRQIVIEEVEGIKSQKVTSPQKVSTPTTPPKTTNTVKVPAPAKIVKNTMQSMHETTASKHTEKKRQINMDTDEYGDLLTMFGPLGYPQGSNFFCPICHRFKTKSRLSFKDHLYREFKYKRFMCKECRVLAVDKCNLMKHIHRVHTIPQSNVGAYITFNPHSNPQLEVWTNKVLQTQASLLTPDTVDLASEETAPAEVTEELLEEQREGNRTPTSQVMSSQSINTPEITAGSPLKSQTGGVSVFTRSVLKPKPAENTGEPKPPEKDPLADEESVQSQESQIVDDVEVDDDDDDECPLVIDEPEEKPKGAKRKTDEVITHTSEELLKDAFNQSHPRPKLTKRGVGQFKCRHCNEKFKQTRGLKMHIKLYHYGLGAFLCGHCNISTNSEQITQKHCRSAHPDKPELVIRNPKAASMILDDDFWEREHNILKGPTGMMVQDAETSSSSEIVEPLTINNTVSDIKCKHCEYKTNSRPMLKQHEKRHWVQKPFRCGNCEFEALREYDIKKHSERIHPYDTVSIVEKPMPSEPDIQPLKRARLETSPVKSDVTKEPKVSNIEVAESSSEADVLTIDDEEEADTTNKNSMLFKCFYCPLKAVKLPDVHQHWAAVHKVSAIAKSGTLPFRYKSIPMTEFLNKGNQHEWKNPSQKVKCAYCEYSGTVKILKNHFEIEHPDNEFKVLRLPNKKSMYKCKYCTFEVHSRPTLIRHHESKHPQLEFDYTINGKPPPKSKTNILPTPKVSQYLCCWCQEKCNSRENMEYHNKYFHSHLEPSYKLVSPSSTSSPPEPEEQISIIPQSSSNIPSYSMSSTSYSSPDITIHPVASTSSTTHRKYYLCPECPEKTKTFRGMEEHIRNVHIKIYQCKECNYILEDTQAVKMHMLVEHPTVVLNNPLQKCEAKVEEMMKFVKKEGDDDEYMKEKIPEFSEISITDILNKNTPINIHPLTDKTKTTVKKVRCVAKKSTTRSIPKNTARKSFPSVIWVPPEFPEGPDYSDSSSDEDDEWFSAYVPPSKRTPQIPLSEMSNIRSKIAFGISSIPIMVDKMSQIINLDAKLIIKDCKK